MTRQYDEKIYKRVKKELVSLLKEVGTQCKDLNGYIKSGNTLYELDNEYDSLIYECYDLIEVLKEAQEVARGYIQYRE